MFAIVINMSRSFSEMLAEDGKKNSLGRVPDVIEIVLADKARLEELYGTIFNKDAWVRMRAIDAFEKISRVRADWVQLYIIRIQSDLSKNTQASIRWHMAQIYAQVNLNNTQKSNAINWLVHLLSDIEVDWIVSANCMATLATFTRNGDFKKTDLIPLLTLQLNHASKAVVKRAAKILLEFS